MERYELITAMLGSMQTRFGEPQLPTYGSPFEGALTIVLGQSGRLKTAITFVEKIKEHLHGELTPTVLAQLPKKTFDDFFFPTKKTTTILGLLAFFDKYPSGKKKNEGRDRGKSKNIACLRDELTAIPGIGLETAYSILLNALDVPVFVPSSAIYRILRRHGTICDDIETNELSEFFMDVLPEDCSLYKQLGALFKSTAINYCKTAVPLCEQCPLKPFLEYSPFD